MSITSASSRAKSRMERLGKSRNGRAGRRLREREASESDPGALPFGFAAGWKAWPRGLYPLRYSFGFAPLRSE